MNRLEHGRFIFLNCYHGLCYNTLLFQTKIWTFMTQHRPSYFADLKTLMSMSLQSL